MPDSNLNKIIANDVNSTPSNPSILSKFVIGGISGISATTIVQPLDLLKSRMQVLGLNTKAIDPINVKNLSLWRVSGDIFKNEGITGFYKGLSAAFCRQIFYTSTRMGCFDTLQSFHRQRFKRNSRLDEKMSMGILSGAIGSFVAIPTEVALVQMTLNKSSKQMKRTNIFRVWSDVYSKAGIKGLWSGGKPTVYRAMMVNCAQLASYSQIKEIIENKTGLTGFKNYTISSFCSGLITSILSLPIDMAKTRMQRQISSQKLNTLQVLRSVVTNEGFLGLWKGFMPYFLRIGSHTALCFLFMEKYKEIQNIYMK
ncbi:MAG: hypothetical protein MHMPM18_001537 [Marteilia pararefringens]